MRNERAYVANENRSGQHGIRWPGLDWPVYSVFLDTFSNFDMNYNWLIRKAFDCFDCKMLGFCFFCHFFFSISTQRYDI